jgi:hypothetical protein
MVEEVGVRLLKLDAGASLETHVGPGGRLVAHLGVLVPDGAVLRLGDETHRWHEGEFMVFDDALPHSVRNDGSTPRYILHLAFPHPTARTIIAASGTPSFNWTIASDCSVVVTNLHNGVASIPEPFVKLFNSPKDNHPTDYSGCMSASLLQRTARATAAAPATLLLRLQAAHGYGSVDVSVSASANYLTFELASLEAWTVPLASHHLAFALMCPVDMCPLPNATAPPPPPGWSAPYPQYNAPSLGTVADGRFQGFRGAEGRYNFSSGFFTISSDWQTANSIFFAQSHWKLGYTIALTADLPAIWAAVRGHEGVPAPNANNHLSWLWSFGIGMDKGPSLSSAISDANLYGVDLLFLADGGMSNRGDFKIEKKRFPDVAASRRQIKAAGLKTGLHFISSGAQVCLEQMVCAGPKSCGENECCPNGNDTCRGTREDTAIVKSRPDLFVPQGIAPRDYFEPNTAGIWYVVAVGGESVIKCPSPLNILNDTYDRSCH